MNEYKKLKKALRKYIDLNEELLLKAHETGNFEEYEKRERRLKAGLKCSVILGEAK
nr:hypothetical protein [uncultured Cellulosilyticum sp.]